MTAGGERLPFSVVVSLALHAGGFALWMHASRVSKEPVTRAIGNVDLLIQVRKPLPAAAPKTPTPPSTWNFLKMALPTLPRAAPQMQVKLPEVKRQLLPEIKKISDRGRMAAPPKLDDLDLGRQKLDAARIEAKLETRKTAALAALPKLEEIGARKVKNLPAALALEERRQEAMGLQKISAAAPEASRRSAPAAAVLREASPPERSGLGDKMAALLPAQEPALDLRPQAAMAAPRRKLEAEAPAQLRRKVEALGEKKKGVEIEGPLADRKVLNYEVPAFPAWARAQGVLEASVAIRFWVAPEGAVLPDMRVERTSGFGRLDRLAMDSLARWRFAPLVSQGKQWGVITFRFLME